MWCQAGAPEPTGSDTDPRASSSERNAARTSLLRAHATGLTVTGLACLAEVVGLALGWLCRRYTCVDTTAVLAPTPTACAR